MNHPAMKSIRKPFGAILLLLMMLPLWGCRDEGQPAAPAADALKASAAEPAGLPGAALIAAAEQNAPVPAGQPLEILQMLPAGDLPAGDMAPVTQVVVMFNQPMAAVGDYAQAPEGALTVTPEVPGALRWLNQYTLAFIPEKPLTGSLELKAEVKPGLKALSGAELREGRQVTLRLPLLTVVDHSRVSEGRTIGEALAPVWQLMLNQEPVAESLAGKVHFVAGGQSIPARVELLRKKSYADEWPILVTPEKPLPVDAAYSIVLSAGIKSQAGPLPAAEWRLPDGWRTYGPLAVTALEDVQQPFGPEYGLDLDFSNPVDRSEVVRHIKIDNGYDLEALKARYAKPEKTAPEAGTAEDEEEWTSYGEDQIRSYLTLPGPWKPNTVYHLTVEAGAPDIYGQKLAAPFEISFKTGAFTPVINFDSGYGVLETATPARLPLLVRNAGPTVEGQAYALTPAEAAAFVRASGFSPSYWYSREKAREFMAGKARKFSITAPASAEEGYVRLPVDLENIFGRERFGRVLYVNIPDKANEPNQPEHSQIQLVQLTDIGLASKIGQASSLIWVTNLAKGESWPGVDVQILDGTGQTVWAGRSDERGLVEAPGLQPLLSRAKSVDGEPLGLGDLFVTAQAGDGQMAFWSPNWNEGLETWRWNLDAREPAARSEPVYWLLNALPLYRPGETAKFKIIGRDEAGDDLADFKAGRKMRLIVRDDRAREIETAVLTFGAFGTAEHEFLVPLEAAVGRWSVSLEPEEGGDVSYIGGFLVMPYRAPAFEVLLPDLPESAAVGEEVALKVKAAYHFGLPVAGQPVHYAVEARRVDYRLPGFEEFNVLNHFNRDDEYEDSGYGYEEPSRTVASGQAVLDQAGGFSVPVKLAAAEGQKPAPHYYGVHASVADVDLREVSNYASFLAHPAGLYVGLAGESFMGRSGQPFKLKVIAATPEGRLAAGREISATLYRRTWQSARRKSPGAAYEYVSRARDEEKSVIQVTSGAGPEVLEVTPDQPGYYWLLAEVKDDQGRINQASFDFYVTGPGPVGWRMANDDRLTLVTDKKEYQPGDVARIMVQSPFGQGEGLCTVERAGVRSAQVFKIDSQAPIIEVPILEDDAPNVFVSVLLTRGRVAEKPDQDGVDLGKPAVRLGYAKLKVADRNDLLAVTVTPARKELGPGQEVDVTVTVRDQRGAPVPEAEVTLIAAEAAVLQLAGEESYYPDRLFQADRSLLVATADNLISLIGRRHWGLKGANPGGGGGLSAGSLAGEGVRRFFTSLAYFNPRVALDAEGQATVRIKMPENLTTFRIFAVATGHGRRGGTGRESVLVTRDLLARSALPGYAGVGDEFLAAMVVSNRGAEEGQATVTLSGDNFTFMEEVREKTVTVAPGASREVSFPVKAGPAAQARFLFSVRMGDDRDAAEFVIPVSPPNKLTTQAAYQRLTPGGHETALALAPGFDPGRGGLSVELSPSLVGVLEEPFDWLVAYPYGCTEQSTSKAYANLVWLGLKDRLAAAGPDKEAEARKHVETQLGKLDEWEFNGGFTYWPNSYDSDRQVYLSAYVLEFILAAREAGFSFPSPEGLARISNYLAAAVNNKTDWPEWHSPLAIRQARVYALAVLARSGYNVAAMLETFYAQRHELSLFELVNLTRAAGRLPAARGRAAQIRELVTLIMNHAEVTAGEVQLREGAATPEIWSSPIRTTAMALTALCEAAPHNELIPGLVRRLVSLSKGGHFGSTQNNISALSALATYVRVMEPENPDLTVTGLIGAETLAEASFKSFTDRPVAGRTSLAALEGQSSPKVTWQVEGQGQVWSSLRLKSAPAAPDLSAETSGGFILSRTLEVVRPEAGEPGQAVFRRGQVVRVTVTMLAPAPRHHVVLEDRIPAGFEPVNFQLYDADQTLQTHLAPRDDRRRFWYNHQEFWPDRVALYSDYLEPGAYTYSYLAMAITPGNYQTPGPQAEEMYAPETYGRGAGQILTVTP